MDVHLGVMVLLVLLMGCLTATEVWVEMAGTAQLESGGSQMSGRRYQAGALASGIACPQPAALTEPANQHIVAIVP